MSIKIRYFRSILGRLSLAVPSSIRQLGSKAVAACLPSVHARAPNCGCKAIHIVAIIAAIVIGGALGLVQLFLIGPP
jgi:hypothetical protein